MVHSQVTRRIDNQSLIINRNGFVFEFLTPSKRIERLDENNSSLLSDHIHIHPCAPINPIVYSSVIRFRRRRKKKKSRLLLFEKLGNKKEKKVRYPLVGTKLGFAYAVANRETLALLFLDIHIPPIPIPIFFPSLFFKSYLHECLEEFLMQTSLKIHVFKTIFQIIRLARRRNEFFRLSNSCIVLRLSKKSMSLRSL